MQVYDHESGRYLCHNKYFGRSLNRETFEEVIEDFFKINNDMVSEEDCAGDQIRIDVINRVIATIEEMITVLNKLDSYRFFTASLLVTYDGQLTTAQSDQSDQLPAAQPDLKYDVRMIDFAHSTHRGLRDEVVHEGPDANFIHGLRTLLQILETLLSKHHQSWTKENSPFFCITRVTHLSEKRCDAFIFLESTNNMVDNIELFWHFNLCCFLFLWVTLVSMKPYLLYICETYC